MCITCLSDPGGEAFGSVGLDQQNYPNIHDTLAGKDASLYGYSCPVRDKLVSKCVTSFIVVAILLYSFCSYYVGMSTKH